MKDCRELSDVTKEYLCCFYEILDTMIEEMTGAELTDSLSHNFIVQMIPHHRAAIEMSQNLLKYTTCLPLQNIASNIIIEQTESIKNMQESLCRCEEFKNTKQDICLYNRRFKKITRKMFTEMEDACTSNNINANFMHEMIPHHEGAIRMSENLLQYDICPELIPILRAIIVSQRKGVCEMERLLRQI